MLLQKANQTRDSGLGLRVGGERERKREREKKRETKRETKRQRERERDVL